MTQGDQNQAKAPLVTIVVPTCDRKDQIAKCVHALAAQTYPNFEIIIVDDCSHDDTPEFLESYKRDNPQVSFDWLRNEQNRGANHSRNRGIHAAGGEVIAMVDSDCVAEPQWLERLMSGFTHENVAAVTGVALDPPPRNIYELTFRGTNRVHGRGKAPRLVSCNLALRRDVLLNYMFDEHLSDTVTEDGGRPDVSMSGRVDEEGIFLRLRADGYDMHVVPEAIVLHEHYYTRKSFFRQAYHGGKAAANLVYKYCLPQRLDMLPFVLAYCTLPLGLISAWLLVVPAFFFAGALAAITYNDLFRKAKTPLQTLISFPMLLVYYHVRLAGYVYETIRLRLTRHQPERVRLNKRPQAAKAHA